MNGFSAIAIALTGVGALSAFQSTGGPPPSATSPPPKSIVILLDITASVDLGDWPMVRPRTAGGSGAGSTPVSDAIVNASFVEALATGDRVRVGALDRRVHLGPWLAPDTGAITTTLENIRRLPASERQGPSPVWDAVDSCVSALEAEPGVKHIFLVTDGLATGNRKSAAEVIARAAATRVAVHVVEAGVLLHRTRFATRDNEVDRQRVAGWNEAAAMLMRLTSATGGMYIERQVYIGVGEAFRRILEALPAP